MRRPSVRKLLPARARKRSISLLAFLPIGYPSLRRTPALADALVRGGADVLELGIPFSDPLADGPVIQAASQAAIKRGATVRRCLGVVRKVRSAHPSVPIVLLTYYNLIFRYGVRKFARDAASAGATAVLAADLPLEEAGELRAACRATGLETVFIIAPNTPGARIRKIAAATTGFLYLMAHFGVTGVKASLVDLTLSAVRRARKYSGGKPVCVGFGISKRAHVRLLRDAGASGAIVGSAFVKVAGRPSSVAKLARSLRV